jgi:hypothetical protein
MTTQHHRHHFRIHMPPSPRHVPRMARRRRRPRLRTRSQTIPLKTGLPDRPRNHLHRLDFRPGVRTVATHSISRRLDYRSRSRQRQRKKWCRNLSNGIGMVRIRITDYRHDRITGYDTQYPSPSRNLRIKCTTNLEMFG